MEGAYIHKYILATIIRTSGTRRGGEVGRVVCGATLEELESGEQGVWIRLKYIVFKYEVIKE